MSQQYTVQGLSVEWFYKQFKNLTPKYTTSAVSACPRISPLDNSDIIVEYDSTTTDKEIKVTIPTGKTGTFQGVQISGGATNAHKVKGSSLPSNAIYQAFLTVDTSLYEVKILVAGTNSFIQISSFPKPSDS